MNFWTWLRYQTQSPRTRRMREGEVKRLEAWDEFWAKTLSEDTTPNGDTGQSAHAMPVHARKPGSVTKDRRSGSPTNAASSSFDKRLGNNNK